MIETFLVESKILGRFGINVCRTLIGIAGTSVSLWFIQRCYGYFMLGEDHPINKALESVGGKSVFLSMMGVNEASAFELIPVVVSAFIAFMTFIGLSAFSALVTYNVIKAIGQRRAKA